VKGGIISLIALLSHVVLLEMYRRHFARQVIHLGVVNDLMSYFAVIPKL
jgi:hypothetical protein